MDYETSRGYRPNAGLSLPSTTMPLVGFFFCRAVYTLSIALCRYYGREYHSLAILTWLPLRSLRDRYAHPNDSILTA